MARLSELVNNEVEVEEIEEENPLVEALEAVIEMLEEDVLSGEEEQELSDVLDFIAENVDADIFDSEEEELTEAPKKRKKPACPDGQKRKNGKCVKKTMKEINRGIRYRKKNANRIKKQNQKWAKKNAGYLAKKNK